MSRNHKFTSHGNGCASGNPLLLLLPDVKNLSFAANLVKNGCLIHIDPQFHIRLPMEFLEAAARYLYYLQGPIAPLSEDAHDLEIGQWKSLNGKLNSLHSNVHDSIQEALGRDCAAHRMIAMGGSDDAQDIAEKLGEGTPWDESHKHFVLCFVGIPGLGKSAIAEGVQFDGRPDLHVKLVSRWETWSTRERLPDLFLVSIVYFCGDLCCFFCSDKLKKNSRGQRFWSMAARQAYRTFGPGESSIVIADKVGRHASSPLQECILRKPARSQTQDYLLINSLLQALTEVSDSPL